jgi:TMEM175 potassium channel family protein
MSNKHGKTDLEKEFELERLILFSDAVFAIAITLLVIDIKFPRLPANIRVQDLTTLFRPTLYQFFGFVISFWFIGSAWSKHLKLFRLLRKYDQGLITRNLVYLFFIVIFPFTASGFASGIESGIEGDSETGILFAIFLYTFNIAFVTICHFILCRYIFYQRPGLSTEGEAAAKKYIYIESRYTLMMVVTALLLCFLVAVVFPGRKEYVGYSFFILPLMAFYMKWQNRKYKPRETEL